MKKINSITYKNENKEELLPDFSPDFPYIASYAELHKFDRGWVPWHWHKEVEFFYMEKGNLEYYTPQGTMVFPAGSGGLVNSNVLHMTKIQKGIENTAMIHIFDPIFLGGWHGSLLEQKYINPIIHSPQIEIIGLYPNHPEEEAVLKLLQESFALSSSVFAYEMKLRSMLSELWCMLLQTSEPLLKKKGYSGKSNDKIKRMMEYIQEHYTEKMTIAEIAEAAYISERECFRTFQQTLHMTPVEYMKSYRIQKACSMLAETKESLTHIGEVCGLGSSSYFGKVFHAYMGCTPKEYRESKWQDRDINRQK